MNNSTIYPAVDGSRRQFMKNTGGILIYIALPFGISTITACDNKDQSSSPSPYQTQSTSPGHEVSVWVKIHEDDRITIMNPTNEMGQGSMTALAVILAEELDADWSKVQLETSPVNADVYGSPGWRGNSMMTVGSRTIMSYFDSLRQAGAQARYVLLSNVADQWNVPLEELRTEPNKVVHQKTNKSISYGEIATFVKPLEEIPAITEDQLKKPENFRLIGKVNTRLDIPPKVDGSGLYALDVKVPNMVYGVIARSPVHGAKPTLENEDAIKSMDGVLDIVALDHGIGLTAATLEQALKAKAQLKIQWSKGATAESHNSDEVYPSYEKVAANDRFDGRMLEEKGDVKKAIQSGAKTYTSDYKNDYIYHAQMEPLNVIVSIPEDESSAEIWVGTQSPAMNQRAIAKMLDIDPSKVKINRYYLGGGFGRRAISDWVEEGVMMARAAKKPVKLVWTREDDLQYGMFRPMSLQRMSASVDEAGKLTGWQHIIVGTGGGLLGSGAKTDFYSFPNQHVEIRNIDHGIRTKHWRAVGHGPNKFAIEAFLDEIAQDLNKDPFDIRMELMAEFPRAQKVLQTAADMANWKTPAPEGRAKGMAFAERSSSLGACVCELSLNKTDGKIKIHNIWASLDAGVIIQPDNAIAQMEGGLIMGISSVLKERLTIKNGVVQESNFLDYPILKMDEIPDNIEIQLIPSAEKPTGIGESAVPLIGGAIANALATLTGKRFKHLPFTPEKVLQVLES